jgi:type I restriction enzyme, S subunit
MNAERLLAQYERIADAPDAVARLRRFILDLAVRGKLVPQDSKDEPAAELLKSIMAEKSQLAETKEFREPTNLVRIDRNEPQFEPPPHWVWARLIDIAQPSYGFAFPSSRFNSLQQGMPLIRIRDISRTDTEAYFDGEYDPAYLVTAGDYLVGMDGDFNLRRWAGKNALLNQRVMRINRWRPEVNPEFVRLPLQMILDHLHGQTSLTTVKHLSAKQVNGIEVPLPPLAEQHRIVAKVNELMALCDRLESARTTREAARDRLTMASLAVLLAPDLDTCQDAARFAIDALPTLTARPDQIKQLRETILNLAMRGKLVPRNVTDEPAPELLNRAKNAKKLLITDRNVTRDSEPEYSRSRAEGVTPAHWSWTYLDEIALVQGGKRLPAGISFATDATEHMYIRVTDMKRRTVSLSNLRYLSKSVHAQIARYTINSDDLYITIAGTIGEVGTIPAILDGQNLTENAAKIVFRAVDREFLCLLLNADDVQEQFREKTKQMAQPKLALKRIAGARIPLPPIEEQHRIAAKVDELMALCDRLEVSLSASEANRSRLLDALLHEALIPVEAHERRAAE